LGKRNTTLKLGTLAEAEEQYLITGERSEDDVDWSDPFLDRAIGPLQVGGLYTFAARKGTGKSFSILRQHLCLQVPSLFISLEDPLREVGRRVAAAPVPTSAKERVALYIPERPRLSLIVEAMKESRARVIGIDYLQVIQDDTAISTFDRAGQVRNIISELKGALRENGQSGLLTAQLRRPETSREPDDTEEEFGPGRPKSEPRGTIFQIRDSSDVENQSEAVILIHRLGRDKFDQTVEAAKSSIGGERRTFKRGRGGWPEEVTKRVDSDPETMQDPFQEFLP
jgi:hypothetical protein